MPQSAKPSLRWSSAAKIAWRELHASKVKFLFVIFSVAIGVAALTGVRGFSDSFERTLLGEARTIMAADLSARMFRQPTSQEEHQLNALAAAGVDRTEVTEMTSMALSPADPVPLLISLKVVDPRKYPFYGSVQLDPAGDLGDLLTGSTVIVADDLLIRLRTQVGASLKIGDASFRIAAVLVREPDRMSSGMGLGPRVLMSEGALAKSGLLQQGSRAGERFLFKLPASVSIERSRARLEAILPDAQITDFRETNPVLTEGLNRSTGLLSLICLVAMVLGAIGVAMAMRAHLQQRVEVLAIMKSIGARSSDILRIYLLQTVLLGIVGGVLGVFFGLAVEWVFPSLLGSLLPMQAHFHFPLRSSLAGLGTGVLTTVLFCLPPLLDIRKVRPNLVLRRMVEEPAGDPGPVSFQRTWMRWRLRLWDGRAQWIVAVVILLGLAGIAAALSDSLVVGRWFAAALGAMLIVMLAGSAITLRLVRGFLEKTRRDLKPSIRHGLANLYRPGNQSAAVLAALGVGVMLILTVFLMQHSVVERMKMTAAPDTPNVFLVDIGSSEMAGVKHLLAAQPGVLGSLETLPVVSGRILSLDGNRVDDLRLKNYPKRLLRSVSLTWSQDLPAGTEVVRGAWWGKDDTQSVAVGERVAERLHLDIGSRIVLTSNSRTIEARVTALIKHDGEHVYGRSQFILTPNALAGLPVTWYGALHVAPKQVGTMQRALFSAYPTVTVINIADIFETIQGVIGQITEVVRFLAAFSILSGAIILASSIASTRFRRIREVVVLKTLGARRKYIVAVFSVEFMVLGLLAGVVGVIFANLLSAILVHRLDVEFQVEWVAGLLAVFATVSLATATGWLASFRILGQKPLEVLREE